MGGHGWLKRKLWTTMDLNEKNQQGAMCSTYIVMPFLGLPWTFIAVIACTRRACTVQISTLCIFNIECFYSAKADTICFGNATLLARDCMQLHAIACTYTQVHASCMQLSCNGANPCKSHASVAQLHALATNLQPTCIHLRASLQLAFQVGLRFA